jgi:hypothetical protein
MRILIFLALILISFQIFPQELLGHYKTKIQTVNFINDTLIEFTRINSAIFGSEFAYKGTGTYKIGKHNLKIRTFEAPDSIKNNYIELKNIAPLDSAELVLLGDSLDYAVLLLDKNKKEFPIVWEHYQLSKNSITKIWIHRRVEYIEILDYSSLNKNSLFIKANDIKGKRIGINMHFTNYLYSKKYKWKIKIVNEDKFIIREPIHYINRWSTTSFLNNLFYKYRDWEFVKY